MEFDVFGELERQRSTYRQFKKAFSMVKLWLSDEEIAEFKKVDNAMRECTLELVDECHEQRICPECGGELIVRTDADTETGNHNYYYCGDCGVRFDD